MHLLILQVFVQPLRVTFKFVVVEIKLKSDGVQFHFDLINHFWRLQLPYKYTKMPRGVFD